MVGIEDSALKEMCSNYVSGTTSSMDFLKYLSTHVFLIPLLIMFLIPVFIVLIPKIVAMKESKKWSKETFWAIFFVAEIIALIILIITIIPILPFHLAI
jgi:hypothetical protein